MNDRTSPARGAPSDEGAGGGQRPPAQMTLWHHLFIWTLVIVVGVLFGMGPSIAVIEGPAGKPDVLRRQTLLGRLQQLGFRTPGADDRAIEQQMKLADIARRQGLMPSGEPLTLLVQQFLDEPARDGKTTGDVLADAKGTPREIKLDELRAYVADTAALNALIDRLSPVPAVPLTVAQDITRTFRDEVTVTSAVLSATRFLPKIADNDPHIEQTYETLKREQRFEQPATVTVTIAYPDLPALTARAKAALTEAQLQAYYAAHKADFPAPAPATPPSVGKTKPGAAVPPPPAPATRQPKPFAAVKGEIADLLAAAQAADAGKSQAEALDKAVEDDHLDGEKDPAGFVQDAKKCGLLTRTATIEQPPPPGPSMYGYQPPTPPLRVPGLGAMVDEPGLFAPDKQVGFTSRVVPVEGPPATVALLRLESRTDAGFKPLAAVRAEVIRYLQGQQAYAPFMAAAAAAQAQAEKLGPDGLRAYLASPAGAVWKATATTEELPASETLTPPPADLTQVARSDGPVAASLALPDHPVALVSESPEDDIPRVKLVQGEGLKPGTPPKEVEERTRYAQQYREELRRYRQMLAQTELRRLEEKD